MFIDVSVLPPLAIEIGFRNSTIQHNEEERLFRAILEKDRPSELEYVVDIVVSTPNTRDGRVATPNVDFSLSNLGIGATRVECYLHRIVFRLLTRYFRTSYQRTQNLSKYLLAQMNFLLFFVMLIPCFDIMVGIAFVIFKYKSLMMMVSHHYFLIVMQLDLLFS